MNRRTAIKHIDAQGNATPITELEDSHLLNILSWHQRKAREGFIVRRGGGTTAEDIWYDEDHLTGEEALEHLRHSHYVQEAISRGLIPPNREESI